MSPIEQNDIPALLSKYQALEIAWEEAINEATKANKLFDQAHRIAKRLRESAEGRAGLLALLSHESRAVRLGAAAECLPFSPDLAKPVLRELASTDGLLALSAKTTLTEFDAGRLNMDW